jgi:two-component system nitrogen regulation response regulator GlnG
MPVLLVVDDESTILLAFRRAFRETAIEVLTAQSAGEGLGLARAHHPDVVVLDVQLPDTTGLELFHHLRDLDARCPIIFITGKSTTDTAIEAMKVGAFDYLLKPLELADLRQVLDRAFALSRLVRVPAVLAELEPVDDRADAIIGRCATMQEVYKAIGRVAGQDVTVLVQGESGTGKELVARAIYQHSRRAAGAFLAVNCAAIPDPLLESELFGHEKGAFTGADRQRIGKFEQCSGGTIFLDEVSDLSPLAQSKMLRILQEQKFERLGSNETIQADVRVLAATNQELETLVACGRFRQDLFYRLSVFSISLPSLRERGGDLPLLVQHFLHRFKQELGKEVQAVSPDALALLRRYPWPGNVRELQSVLKQALLQATGPMLLPEFLPTSVRKRDTQLKARAADTFADPVVRQFIEEQLTAGSETLYGETLRRVERQLLMQVLQHTAGNQLQASRILGITRGCLRNRIRELGITIARTVEGEET